ncbi:MAG: lipopolysaccharide assembly protein LapA domain-containing protein [Synergistaceae bacterium]|jgi:uncharacterized membrane protein YciS (DUF1049 family)|nr:lipopolysaccharide assembly protein LapA domain-containing protein [Synergistaceae bacterium]
MKSYLLGIIVVMVMSMAYAVQNDAEITVRFFVFQKSFPQGLWEGVLFSASAVIMWFFSVFASIELYSANKKKTKELSKRIEDLESEKKTIFAALQQLSGKTEGQCEAPDSVCASESGALPAKRSEVLSQQAEPSAPLIQQQAEDKPEALKKPFFRLPSFGSLFSRKPKPEAAGMGKSAPTPSPSSCEIDDAADDGSAACEMPSEADGGESSEKETFPG